MMEGVKSGHVPLSFFNLTSLLLPWVLVNNGLWFSKLSVYTVYMSCYWSELIPLFRRLGNFWIEPLLFPFTDYSSSEAALWKQFLPIQDDTVVDPQIKWETCFQRRLFSEIRPSPDPASFTGLHPGRTKINLTQIWSGMKTSTGSSGHLRRFQR